MFNCAFSHWLPSRLPASHCFTFLGIRKGVWRWSCCFQTRPSSSLHFLDTKCVLVGGRFLAFPPSRLFPGEGPPGGADPAAHLEEKEVLLWSPAQSPSGERDHRPPPDASHAPVLEKSSGVMEEDRSRAWRRAGSATPSGHTLLACTNSKKDAAFPSRRRTGHLVLAPVLL